MAVVIREMTIEDYDDVIALWSETENMSLRDADSKQSIGHYLERNPGLSFVVQDGEGRRIVGAVLAGTDGRRGYLQHLSVSTDYRGHGLGKQLVNAAVQALNALGIAKTHLFVLNENSNAQQFYQANGWFARDEVRMFSFNSSTNKDV
ncbi:GNAT family N-acetyltransferase [Reinekea marinisedimentorum]|uniref:Ribosomal protein S18 acetylase RimI-like enzyme n=1 Tax=Reinekea marinisedimentorum TaxID=230495 RepID=A0A4R3I782_9GAMM|nr:GNAT family N-acetyltransferase [Reinekea marinisedimentorum]TCS41017.1 ribosomal protein S18 acetylase RimI-like enzyme [Reinekea marinisedimentorum]